MVPSSFMAWSNLFCENHFFCASLVSVLQEAREGLREGMAKDVVTLNAELSASHNEFFFEKHGHIPTILDLDHHLLLSTPSLSTEMPMLLTMTSQGGTWDFPGMSSSA
jgi:hypothetical protein